MAPGSGFARRFIAGESIEEAVECVTDLPGKGLLLTLDYLGESVSSAAAASAAAADYVADHRRDRRRPASSAISRSS